MGHVEYGLKHVDGLCWLCTCLIDGVPSGDLTISVGDKMLVRRPSFAVLQNSLAEAGLIYCRKLLDFLGLKIDRNCSSLKARSAPYSDDTVGIEDLGLPRLDIAQLSVAPLGSGDAIQAACEHTIRSANKGVAHFTEDRGDRAEEKPVLLCGQAVAWLVAEYVYKPLDVSLPEYRVWTKT